MGMKPPIFTDSPGSTIRNAANVPHKERHHNPSKNAATIAHGPGEVPTESYVANESMPMRSPQLKPLPGKTDLGKGSPRPDLKGQGTYGPTGKNPAEVPLKSLVYSRPAQAKDNPGV